MEVKNWTYEEFPEYIEKVEGAIRFSSTGEEVGVRYFHDVEYMEIDGVALHLQILQPYTRNHPETIYPVMVFVQGSAWRKQETHLFLGQIANMAKKGYVIAVVEYRHSGIAPFPAQIQDAKNAVRYMRLHAKEYQGDPENMIIAGSSSGGHTALFTGIIKDGEERDCSMFPGVSAEVKGIIDQYGAVNLMKDDGFPTTLNHHLPDSPEGMLMGGRNMRENRELRKEATVETYITSKIELPPICIIHGTKDRTVYAGQSASLFRKLRECGKEAELYLIEGADHGGAEFWTEEMCDIMDNFIKKKCLKTIR